MKGKGKLGLAHPKGVLFLTSPKMPLMLRRFGYVRTMGTKAAFGLGEYLKLQVQQAESAKRLFYCYQLVNTLVDVSPVAKVKLKYLKQCMANMMPNFGSELLRGHFNCAEGLCAGNCADCIGVILNHWRSVTGTDKSWEKF